MTASRKRVLVADDEHAVADSLVLIFQAQGFETIAAYSGPEAVLAAISFQPDVAILDVVMGTLSGIDAGVLISGQLPNCTILLFSGQFQTTELLQRAKADGYNFEIFAKPVHPTVFLDYLRALPN